MTSTILYTTASFIPLLSVENQLKGSFCSELYCQINSKKREHYKEIVEQVIYNLELTNNFTAQSSDACYVFIIT